MRLKTLKISMTILLMLSIVLASACSSKTQDSQQGSGQTQGEQNAGTSQKTEPTELLFFFPIAVGGSLQKVFDKLAEDFNKEHGPDLTVKMVYTGDYKDTMMKVQTGVLGNNAPDVTLLSSTELFTLLDMDAIIPLDDLIAEDGGQEYINDFYDAFLANARTGGKIYSIPFQRSTIILYYNKDLFREAGLDPEKPPKNYNELVEYAKKLTKDGRWGLEISSTDYVDWMFQALALQNGKNLMNEDGTEVYFYTPSNVEALQFWVDLIKKHKVMPEGASEWATIPTDFISQNTAMMYHTTGNLGAVKKGATFDFGTAFLPAGKNYGTPVGGGNLYIVKGKSPERQKQAWKLIRWLTQPERLAQFSIDTGYVAPTKSSYETEVMKEYVKTFPQALTARDQLQYASASFATHAKGEVGKILTSALQSAIVGGADPDAALKKAQEEADKILAQFKK